MNKGFQAPSDPSGIPKTVASTPVGNDAPIIVAALAWYNETPETLDRCVRSLHGIADFLVALDGRWEGMSHGQNGSGEQHVATAVNAIGISCFITDGVWRSQVEKRTFLMRIASNYGDWIFVIDADEHLEPTTPDLATQLRHTLATTTLDVATVNLHEGSHSAPIRRIYRSPVTVHHAHNGYMTPDGRWLHGNPSRVTLETTVETPLQLIHDRNARTTERQQAALAYRSHRVREQTERWPDLDL